MFTDTPYGLDKLVEHDGDGSYLLRTETCAQPRALKPGDWLANGDRVLSRPDEGGNGQVVLYLTGGHNGYSIGSPARIPVALAQPHQSLPLPNKRCDELGHNPYRQSGYCARCGADVPIEHVPMPEWAPSEGPWCLRQWIPFHVAEQSVMTCLLAEKHEGDCRDQQGFYHNTRTSLSLPRLKVKDAN